MLFNLLKPKFFFKFNNIIYPCNNYNINKRYLSIIGDTMSKIASNKIENDKDKRFATMLSTMLSGEKWSLRQWKKTMDDQMNTWLMYIPGMKNSPEMKDLTSFKFILESLTELQLDNPSTIDGKAKENIAIKTGKPVEEISRLLMFYRQSQIVQEWLVLKKSLNEQMPQNENELARMQETDIRLRTITNKLLGASTKRKSGRGRSPF